MELEPPTPWGLRIFDWIPLSPIWARTGIAVLGVDPVSS